MSTTQSFTNLPSLQFLTEQYSLGESLFESHLTVTPNILAIDVVRLLSMHEYGYCHQSKSNSVRQRQNCVLIVEDSQLVGIFTKSDAMKLMALEVDLTSIKIESVMQSHVITLTQSTNIWTALSSLRDYDISHLPVLDEQGAVLGVITATSLLQVLTTWEKEQITLHQELDAVKQSLRQAEAEIERRVEERTFELLQANVRLQEEIVERNRISDALRESEERFRTMADTAPVMIWVSGTDKLCNYFNKGWLEFTGRTLEEEIGSGWVSRVHPDDYEYCLDTYYSSFDLQQPFSMEYRLLRHDSEYRWILDTGTPRFNVDGSFAGFIGSCIDISDRKLSEQKIREQAALLDVANDAIFVRSLDSKIFYWNKGAERLYGWSAAEVIGKSATEILYKKKDSLQIEVALRTVAETGVWRGELNKVHKDRKEIIVESHWTMVYDAAGQQKCILTVDTDITEKKLLEAQFLRTQRLESLGILASGIAHDLNNILTPILAIAQLLPLTLPPIDERNQNMLQILEANTKRGADLVKQILSFARGGEGNRTLLQVKHLILDIEKIAKGTFPKSIEIKRNILDTLWTVKGDATQLHQVFMNLAVNARDAMPDGGTLTITAENQYIDTNYAGMNIEAKAGAYVAVTFTDSGVGISSDNLDKIFDPFFTTKDLGKGTGLGLSTVHSIIKNHHGFVEVRSEVNNGSSFRIYLPASKHTAKEAVERLQLPGGNGELILFVDDEAAISEIAKNTLETHNYRVLVANNGIEAIALYAQHKHQLKAVVMDLIMPSLDGTTAIRALQKMNPQVSIIVMSGTSEINLAHGIKGMQGFLEKPFTAKHLLSSLHNAIVRGN
jgi:PAS domain S-box-containing protein